MALDTCLITQLPIRRGDAVRVLLLVDTHYPSISTSGGFFAANTLWAPRCLPLCATAGGPAREGSIHLTTPRGLIERITLEGFRQDLAPGCENARFQDLTRDNVTLPDVICQAAQGRLRVARENDSLAIGYTVMHEAAYQAMISVPWPAKDAEEYNCHGKQKTREEGIAFAALLRAYAKRSRKTSKEVQQAHRRLVYELGDDTTGFTFGGYIHRSIDKPFRPGIKQYLHAIFDHVVNRVIEPETDAMIQEIADMISFDRAMMDGRQHYAPQGGCHAGERVQVQCAIGKVTQRIAAKQMMRDK